MRSLFENIFLTQTKKGASIKNSFNFNKARGREKEKNYKYLEEIMNVLWSISRKCAFISSHSLAGSTCTCELKILS